MANDTVDRSIAALQKLESEGDVDDLVALYGDDAVCGVVTTTVTHTGPDGARRFWSGYRETFSEIRSDLRGTTAYFDPRAISKQA